MPDSPDVLAEILDRLRALCTALPDVYEEQAWVGTRWLVRRKTFAHVLGPDLPLLGRRARRAGRHRPPLLQTGLAPAGRRMVVEPADWTEIGELLTESYCLRAPRKLVALVRQPGPAAGGPG